MSSRNQISSASRPIVDLYRSGMNVWDSAHDKSSCTKFLHPLGELSWESNDDLQSWFAKSIENSRLSSEIVDLHLPRSTVCLHLLELPRADEAQLAGMIQIQVESLYGERAENIAFDYSPLKWPSDTDLHQFVLLATVPKTVLTSVRQLCEQAGLSLSRILIRDLAVNHAMLRSESSVNYVVWLGDDSRTLGIALGNQIIQTISFPITAQLPIANVFRGYERRLLQSLPSKCLELAVGKRLTFVAVTETAQQKQAIEWAKSIGFEYQVVSNLGELYQTVQSEPEDTVHLIDFVNPYRTKPAKNIRRSAMLAASLTALFFTALFVYRYLAHSAGEAELATLQQRIMETQAELDSMSETSEQLELVEGWQKSRVNWGHELSLISQQASAVKDAYLYRLQLDSFDGDRLPLIRMDGRAKSVPEAMKWNRQLSKLNDRYSIQPQSLDSGVSDPEFPTQFRVEAQLNNIDFDSESSSPPLIMNKSKYPESDSNRT